jgi:Flp pilus assembly CpaF family ATPase
MQKELFQKIDQQIMRLELHVDSNSIPQENSFETSTQKIINTELTHVDPITAQRIRDEFPKYGPLSALLDDQDISEILVNDYQNIWVEKMAVFIAILINSIQL